MNQTVAVLIAIILAIGCIAFIYGIYKACAITLRKEPPPDPAEMPPALSNIVITIAAILSTNFGGVLGIELAKPNSFGPDFWRSSSWFEGAPSPIQLVFVSFTWLP